MFCVILSRRIAVRGFADYSVVAYRNVHSAAANVVNAGLSVAHTNKSVHKMRLAVVIKRYNSYRVHGGRGERVHFLVLFQFLLNKELFVFAKPLEKHVKIGIGGYILARNSASAEIVDVFREYRLFTFAERLESVAVGVSQIEIITSDKVAELFVKQRFIVKVSEVFL